MVSIPTTEPTQVYAGDTWQWNRTDLSDTYPASSWNLLYYFNSRSPAAQFSLTAVADGDDYSIVVLPVATAALTISNSVVAQSGYHWVARAEHQSDGRVFTIGQGNLDVLLSLQAQAAGGYDPRSWAETSLAALEAVIQGRATRDQLSYTMPDGRTIEKMKPEQIRSWYAWFKDQVRQDKAAASGGGSSKTIRVQFARGY